MRIRIRASIEILGKPKKAVKMTLEKIGERIEDREYTEVLEKHFEKLKPEKKDFFSSFLEIELWINGFNNLIGFILDFGPISIEILEPEELNVDAGVFEESINQLIGKFHDLDDKIKILSANLVKSREKTSQN